MPKLQPSPSVYVCKPQCHVVERSIEVDVWLQERGDTPGREGQREHLQLKLSDLLKS